MREANEGLGALDRGHGGVGLSRGRWSAVTERSVALPSFAAAAAEIAAAVERTETAPQAVAQATAQSAAQRPGHPSLEKRVGARRTGECCAHSVGAALVAAIAVAAVAVAAAASSHVAHGHRHGHRHRHASRAPAHASISKLPQALRELALKL